MSKAHEVYGCAAQMCKKEGNENYNNYEIGRKVNMKLKKTVSRAVSCVAAVTLAISLLAGCGNKENSSKESTSVSEKTSEIKQSEESVPESTQEKEEIVFPLKDTMEFSAMTIMSGTYNVADNLAWNTLLDRANIKVDLTEFPASEMKEKGGLVMAGGDYPDFLFKCSYFDLDGYGQDGLLIPLEDLIREYAPNLCNLLDERDAWGEITAPDGHVYALPLIQNPRVYGTGNYVWWLNQKWMDNLGLKEPTNAEELYEVLKAFKEQDANGNGDPNDEIPWTFYEAGLYQFLLWVDDASMYGNYFAVKDGEIVFYPLTDGFKDQYLSYLTKMYQEGILDPNGYTQTMDQLKAVAQSGEIYGMFPNSGTSLVKDENRLDYIALKPFNRDVFPLNKGLNKGGMAITDKCENPEVLIAWADYMYTEDGGRIVRMGVEGESYTIDENGNWSWIDGKWDNVTYQCTLLGSAQVPFKMPELWNRSTSQGTQHDNEQLNGENGLYTKGLSMPTLQFTEEENQTISTLMTDIKNYVDVYSAQVITGEKKLEDSYAEFQETLKKMQVEEITKIYQDAYERVIK